MLEMNKGNKSVKVPGVIITAGVITWGVCTIVSDICNAVVSKKK